MLKIVSVIVVMLAFHSASFAATPEEKKAEVLLNAQALVEKFGGSRDPASLKRINSQIEHSWENYTKLYGTRNPLAIKLALLRARSATAAKQKKRVAANWRTAIKLLPVRTKGAQRLIYYTQAANASADVRDYKAAEQFFAAAQIFAVVRGSNADKSRLYLRLQELKTAGDGMEWRRLNDSLLDMRKFSENFVMWSIPRLDALLGEAEIRLVRQPNDDKDKRMMLGDLKARIQLVQKGMNGSVPPIQVDRIRTLFYALEDNFGL